MVKQGSGHIVNLASVEGLMPFPSTMSYVTSKFGVMGLSEGMWVEGKDLGVNVSVVCPGFVSTPIFDVSDTVGVERRKWREALSQWERFAISPEGCAQVILKEVEKNKPIITVTLMAKVMWWLTRISPTFIMNFARRDFNKWRDKARLTA
jgi:short-subunit dehydrogenase